jgi:hypothetical protein
MFAFKKTKNKIPWAHTIIKHAMHAYQWSYIFTPLTCIHRMGICNCVSSLGQLIFSKSIADSVALTTVTDAVGSEQLLTKCGYVNNNGRFWIEICYASVSQTVVRRPQVVLGFCPCGPLRLNISPKKTEKIKLT